MVKKEIILKNNMYSIEKEIELEIFDGYNSKENLIHDLKKLNLNLNHVAIIEFLNMFYAVCIDGFNKEIIIGSENIIYRNGVHMVRIYQYYKLKNFKLPYKINGIDKRIFHHTQIYSDLKKIDNNITIYIIKNNKWTNITEYKYSKTYAILLGLPFYNTFFNKDEYVLLSPYFDIGYYLKLYKEKNIIGINPFMSKVMFKDGTIKSRYL